MEMLYKKTQALKILLSVCPLRKQLKISKDLVVPFLSKAVSKAKMLAAA